MVRGLYLVDNVDLDGGLDDLGKGLEVELLHNVLDAIVAYDLGAEEVLPDPHLNDTHRLAIHQHLRRGRLTRRDARQHIIILIVIIYFLCSVALLFINSALYELWRLEVP